MKDNDYWPMFKIFFWMLGIFQVLVFILAIWLKVPFVWALLMPTGLMMITIIILMIAQWISNKINYNKSKDL